MRRVEAVMALSSGSSSRCQRRVTLIKQPSREDACKRQRRFCHHGFIAPLCTAWTEGNPGRRFYLCRNYYQDGGCGYFAWHNCEFGERANVVIKELLNDIDKVYDENKLLRRENGGACLCEEVDSIHCELSKLKRISERQNSEVRKEYKKLKILMFALLMTWIWLLIVYLRECSVFAPLREENCNGFFDPMDKGAPFLHH